MRRVVFPILLSIVFSIFSDDLAAQGKMIDSLLTVLNTSKEDSNKVNILNAIGWSLRIGGKLEDAIKYENTALELAKKIKYKKGEGQAYGNMGLMLWDLGKYPEARTSHYKALNIREAIGDKRGAGNSYTNLGHIFYDEGNFDSALFLYKKCLKIREETKDEQGIADCYNNIGNVYQAQGNFSEALNSAKSALATREKIKDYNGIASSYGNIGLVYKELGNYNDALQNHISSLKLAETIGNKMIMASALGNIGTLYSLQGNLPEALKYQLGALKIRKEMGHKRGISISCDNIGVLYIKQENYPEALKYLQQASKINEELGDKYGQASNFTNFGSVYSQQAKNLLKKNQNRSLIEDKLDSGLKYFKSALNISLEIGDKQGAARSYYNLGYVYVKKENYVEAIRNDSAALKLFEAIGEKYGIAMTYAAFGDAYIKMGSKNISKENFKNASQNLNKSLEIAEELRSRELIKGVYESFAELYEVSLDYKQALEFTNLYYSMNDSILSKESSQKMEGLRLQYEVEIAKTDEKNKQEKIQAEMQFTFAKREDSLKYQQSLTQEQLNQQKLLAKQQEQSLLLKQASLDLSNRERELTNLGYLKSQAELQTEQSRRQDKEKQLTIAEQEKSLQQYQLQLKENEIQTQKKQRLFYIGGIVLLLLLFVFIYRNIKARQTTEGIIAAERLKSEKASAAHKMAELELQSLRAQLNPHFMFNSLNAIQELILKEDNDNSHLYLSRFSELLRMLLDNANQPFVSLRKEINLLELYLSLENLRIPDLKYYIEIDPSIDTNKTAIPNMMLQPYIENAIWHGLSHKKGERSLHIRIKRKDDLIVCEVEDNGVGRKMSAELKSLYRKEHRSRGMELLSKRFSLLSKEYGSEIHTTVEDLHDNGTALGTRVAISVPYSLTEQTMPVYS